MIKYSEISRRYGIAFFNIAHEKSLQNRVLEELQVLEKSFISSKDEVSTFILSPVVKAKDKKKILELVFQKFVFCEETKNFIFFLAEKRRLSILSEIIFAYQHQSDEEQGITRGMVYSAKQLNKEEQKEIEKVVSSVTNKNVIINYKEDSNLIGGLMAQVGTYVFDDTIKSHLRRLKEELNRRAH